MAGRSKSSKAWTVSILGVVGALAVAGAAMPNGMTALRGVLGAIPNSAANLSVETWKVRFGNVFKGVAADLRDGVNTPLEKGIAVGMVALGFGLATKVARKLRVPSAKAGPVRVKLA